MLGAVARQEGHRDAAHRTEGDGPAGHSVGSLHLQKLDLVQQTVES